MSELLRGIADLLTDPATYQGRSALQNLLLQHVSYAVTATLIAAAIAIPLGLWVGHRQRGDLIAVTVANTGRAIPDFGIILVAMILIGRGVGPVLIALVALAIPPILVNTYVGVRQVDRDAVDAARGAGMTGWQVLREVEVPIALPLIMTGVRTSAVQVVATAALAGYIGLGGLGRMLFDGFAAGFARGARPGLPRIIVASVLVAILAVITELLLARLERSLTPAGLRHDAATDHPDPEHAALTTRGAA